MNLIQKPLITFLLLTFCFLPILVFGQKGLYTSISGGVNVSYNRLVSDKPLPEDPVALRRAGSCRNFDIQYQFHTRFSMDFSIKAASIKRGLKGTKYHILGSDSLGQYVNMGGIGLSYISNSPLHVQIGASIYPIIKPRFEWKVGTGIAAMKIKDKFSPPIILKLDAEDFFYSSSFKEEEELRRTGWLMNLNTSLSYRVGQRGAIILTLNHSQSLSEIFEHQSINYTYYYKKTGILENYKVRLLNNASYSSCTLGYSYQIFTAK